MDEQNDNYNLIPPAGSKDVGEKVFLLLTEIVEDKKDLGLHEKWLENYRLSKNKHWKMSSKKVPLVSANLLFMHRQRTVNMLTDNNPTFNIAKGGDVPRDQQEVFSKLQRAAEYWWTETEQQDFLETSVINGEMYGVTIEKTIFNPDLEYGEGEVETVIVDPFCFGLYPITTKNVQKAEAVLHFYPSTVREMRRLYPQFASKIKPDSEYLQELGSERRELAGKEESTGRGALVTLAGAVKELINFVRGSGTGASDDQLLVVECWVKDYTEVTEVVTEEREALDENGQIVIRPVEIEIARPKYPGHIRYILTCNGGEVVLEDKGNPNVNSNLPPELAQKTYLYDKFPFIMATSIKDNETAWGMSDFEQLEQLNKEFNKSLSQLILMKDKATRLKIKNPITSGVDNKEFTNYPGIINPVNATESAGIQYLDFPQVPVDIQNAAIFLRDLFFSIAGTFDLDRAQVSDNKVIAYKAIAALLENASTMMRGKLRSYSRLIRERGRMYLSHLMNFYTEDRWISYSERGIEKPMRINGIEMIVPAKLSVVSGSTMPISKIQQREEAIALFTQGAIDREDLLEKLDWSGRAEVLKRMRLGPLADLFEKLAFLGLPQDLLGLVQQLAQMEQKDVERAAKEGKLPSLQGLGAQKEETDVSEIENLELQEKAMQIEKTRAEVGKVQTESLLVAEKINTEKVEQQVRLAGIQFDDENLKIERAKTVSDIEKTRKLVPKSRSQGTPPYKEKGLKSNNQELEE